jgi:hypothetical protein
MTAEHRKLVCPRCRRSDSIDIAIVAFARYVSAREGYWTDTDVCEDRSHEWDENSSCVCRACGFGSRAVEFMELPKRYHVALRYPSVELVEGSKKFLVKQIQDLLGLADLDPSRVVLVESETGKEVTE